MIALVIIVFSLSTVAITSTVNVILSLYVIVPTIIVCCIIGIFQKKTLAYFFVSAATVLVVIVSVTIFLYRYNTNITQKANNLVHINDKGHIFLVATGTILEKQTHNRYLRKSDTNVPFFLYTDKNYQPGDYIRITARANLVSTGTISLFFSDPNEQLMYFIRHRFPYKFDFSRWQLMKSVAGSLLEDNSIFLGKKELPTISKIKHEIQRMIHAHFPTDSQRGLIAGMLLGDRSLLPQSDYQLFIDSGIVHIIAVSGGHIMMIVIFLQTFLFFIPFYPRVVLILLAVVAYGMICGLSGSVLRAVLMGSLSLVALFLGRQTVVRRSLLIAYLVMLLVNPFFLLYDIGFIFSFMAVIGISYMTTWTQQYKLSNKNMVSRLVNHCLHNYIFPSVGASIMVTPFLLLFTGSFNLMSIVANILIFPVVPIIMLGSLLIPLLHHIDVYFLDNIVNYSMNYLYWIAHKAQYYGIYLYIHDYLFAYVGVVLVIVFIIRDRLYLSKH